MLVAAFWSIQMDRTTAHLPNTPVIDRRAFTLGSLAFLGAMPSSSALADEPVSRDQPLKLMVGFAAGTGPDFAVRTMAPFLAAGWPQGVAIDNRPGAGGMLALAAAGAAPPDGTSLVWASIGEIAINPHLYAKIPFDPAGLVPVFQMTNSPLKLVTGSQQQGASLGDLLAATKSRERLTIGTFGPGTPHHLIAVMLGDALNRKVEPVHYRTPSDMLTDLSSGQLDAGVSSSLLAIRWEQTGKVRILGTTGASRAKHLPSVPTFEELGVKAAGMTVWSGMFAPPKTPDSIVRKINSLAMEAARKPDFVAKLEANGAGVEPLDTAAFASQIVAERNRFGALIKRIGLKIA